VLKVGYLKKQASSFPRTWQGRWFQLFCLPAQLVYSSEKDASVTIPLSADCAVSEIRATGGTPAFEFSVRTAQRVWHLGGAVESEIKDWAGAIARVIALAGSKATQICVAAEAAIAELQQMLVYGHVKYQGRTFLRTEHGQNAETALARVRQEVAAVAQAWTEVASSASSSPYAPELQVLLDNYRACVARASVLVSAMWIRIRAQDAIERYKAEVRAAEVALGKGEHELAAARKFWDHSKVLLEGIRNEPEFRRGFVLRSMSSQDLRLKELRTAEDKAATELSLSVPGGVAGNGGGTSAFDHDSKTGLDPSAEAPRTDAPTVEEDEDPESMARKVEYIQDVQEFLDELELSSQQDDMARKLYQMGNRRRPSIVKSKTAAIDRALTTVEQVLRECNTLYKGSTFMTPKRVNSVMEKAAAFEAELEEFRKNYSMEPSLRSMVSKYDQAWRNIKRNMDELKQRETVHTLFDQIAPLITQTSLSVAGRKLDAAVASWEQVKLLVEQLINMRDRAIRSSQPGHASTASLSVLDLSKPLRGDSVDDDVGTGAKHPAFNDTANKDKDDAAERESSTSDSNAPPVKRAADLPAPMPLSMKDVESVPVYVLDIDFFLTQFRKRSDDIEVKLPTDRKEPLLPASSLAVDAGVTD